MLELNRIYCLDVMEGLKQLDDESIDLIITDPPYKTTKRGGTGNSGGMLQKDINKNMKTIENTSKYLIKFLKRKNCIL